ncbi:MAG TPA: folate-binding protein [Hyphomicrobiaceae bacterium]|jgi:folate-binding protein YgfZ|nr:folate-binding protein [Hyphomicrobiaceae bacterium]
MTDCQFAVLNDRGVVRAVGPDAERLLQGLITGDVNRLKHEPAIHAGLLTPQGKILFDFFVARASDGYLIDVLRDRAADLVKRLSFYKLRAQVSLNDVSSEYGVAALWGGPLPTGERPPSLLVFPDPRLPALGWRVIGRLPFNWPPRASGAMPAAAAHYHAHRIGLGVPEGGRDYVLGDTFPQEALFDQLRGVDFDKGCYVGQEVVSRIQHRATVRKRVVKVQGPAPLPAPGTDVKAGPVTIGTLGSVSEQAGLALLRVDRAAEAQSKNIPLTAAGVPLTVVFPSGRAL